MTFEEWADSEHIHGCRPDAAEAWNASRQALLAELGSEGMVRDIAKNIYTLRETRMEESADGYTSTPYEGHEANNGLWSQHIIAECTEEAQAAIKAIQQALTE